VQMLVLSILSLASALAPPITFCSVVQKPNLDLLQLIIEVSRSHKIRHTPVRTAQSDQLVAEATLPTQHKTETVMPSWGFEPTIPAVQQLQTYALGK
jgi:hypothetical protein